MKQIAIIIMATFMSVTLQAQEAPQKPIFNDTSLCQVLVDYRRQFNLNNETLAHTLSVIATKAEGYYIEYSEKDIHDMLTCNYCLLPKSDKAVRQFIKSLEGKRP